jgi:hypothetical protein
MLTKGSLFRKQGWMSLSTMRVTRSKSAQRPGWLARKVWGTIRTTPPRWKVKNVDEHFPSYQSVVDFLDDLCPVFPAPVLRALMAPSPPQDLDWLEPLQDPGVPKANPFHKSIWAVYSPGFKIAQPASRQGSALPPASTPSF